MDARTRQRASGRVDDVQQRNPDGGFDARAHVVHRVRAQHETGGARALQSASGLFQQSAGAVPVACLLPRGDRGEVDAVQHEIGRVEAAEPGGDAAIDQAIVFGSRFPAHPADQPESSHVPTALGRWRS